MTENTENPTPTGAPSQPTSGASGGATGTSSIVTDELLSALEQLVDRKLQATKDKRVAGLMGKLDDFESRLARLNELEQEGWNKKQALKIMQLEDIRGPVDPLPTDAQRPGSQAAQPPSFNPQSVIESMGLDPNSPEVIEAIRKNPDPLGQVTAFAALAQAKKTAPAPSPAQQQPTASGTSVAQDTIETLTEKLVKLMERPTQAGNMEKIRETREQIAKLRG